MTKLPSKTTLRVREALEELLLRSDQEQRREVTEMFLGPDIFVALLRHRQVVEGEWEDTNRTIDLLDLMERFSNGMMTDGMAAEKASNRQPVEQSSAV